MKKTLILIALMATTVFTSGCRYWLDPDVPIPHKGNRFIYMPDMVYSQSVKAQEEGSMRAPVKGTVPRHKTLYALPETEDEAARLKNPLRKTVANLQRGKELFNIYCSVCHGPYGEGNGSVVPLFPQPPTLQSDKVRGYYAKGEEGRIFYLISKGRNNMPSYASQIDPIERWKVAMYIQALHKAKNPTAEDLKAAENF